MDVKKRVLSFLKLLSKINNKKNIIIITHSFFLRVLMGLFYNLDLKKIHKLQIGHLQKLDFIRNKNLFLPNLLRNDVRKFCEQIND